MSTHIILNEDITIGMNVGNCCDQTIQPSTPITTIFSCHDPIRKPEVLPKRSTFCFPESTMKYKSLLEIRNLRYQWDTFERVENINSIVQNNLANQLPIEAGSGFSEPPFYQFTSSDEKTAYNQGQLAHTVAYPDVTDFLVSYSARAIPYTSTVLSTIASINYQPQLSTGMITACSKILPTLPRRDSDILLRNKNGLNLYVRVSTQIAEFPKSPYKFSSNSEYTLYNEYKRILS